MAGLRLDSDQWGSGGGRVSGRRTGQVNIQQRQVLDDYDVKGVFHSETKIMVSHCQENTSFLRSRYPDEDYAHISTSYSTSSAVFISGGATAPITIITML